VTWNTYSHTPECPRWRAFIPTTHAMSIEVHALMLRQIEDVLNRGGYWSDKQITERPKGRTKRHGFDTSKFNAASLFYLPAQAKNPACSFFHDHGASDPKRGPLDLCAWVQNCILDLKPEPEPEPEVVVAPAAAPVLTNRRVSAKLQVLQDALDAERTKSMAGRREARVAKAIEDWRHTPRGQGHSGFFRLAAALLDVSSHGSFAPVHIHDRHHGFVLASPLTNGSAST
jgi:hypothetical protein